MKIGDFTLVSLAPSLEQSNWSNKMHDRYVKLVGMSLVIATLSLVGSAFAAITTKQSKLADSWTTAKTKIAIAADSRVKGRQVSVETRKGVVTLRGKVDDADAKAAARTIAGAVDGVKRVDNELQVVAPGKRDSVDEKDESVTAHVKDQILRDAEVTKDNQLKAANIGVVTNAGVVSLTGEVPTILVSARASWTAWQVPGVKSVRNDLTLPTK